MRRKWESGLSLFLAAALTVGSMGFTSSVTAQAQEVGTKTASARIVSGDETIAAASYYIDAVNGDDNNAGTSESAAWKTFANLKGKQFTAGDKILLKADCIWNDQKLEITGAVGTKENPVVLGKYGDGANPIINGNGSSWLTDRSDLKKEDVAAVHVKDSKYVTIENLEVTNWENDKEDLMGETGGKVKFDQSKYMLTGILVENHDAGELPGIVIQNNYVHDVNGYMSKNGSEGHKKGSGGIMVLVTGGTTESYFKDLQITGNKVEKVCHEAIYMESCWAARVLVGGKDSQQAGDKKWVGWPNVSVTHNYVNDVAGDGIVLINADGGIAEYNLVTKSASEEWDYSRNPAHAAIWMWDCNNVTMQYNEAAYTTSTQDGMAFDCDYGNQNVMYQYNYSHDNKGGFWMACPGPYYTVNSVVRYNVSVNDGLFDGSRIMRVGERGSIGHQVYNNTIYWDHKYKVNAVEQGSWGTPPTSGTDIYNNIFCGNTQQFVNNEGIHYANNCVWGGAENAYPFDEDMNAVVADPGFVDVANRTDGSFKDGRVTLGSVAGMELKQSSPCIDAGKNLMAVPEESLDAVKDELVQTHITLENKDYKGNAVPHTGTKKVDIGAFEYQGAGNYQPVPGEVNKEYLQAIYDLANSYKEADFTSASWANMISAKDAAKKVLDNANAAQKVVDSVAVMLERAVQKLKNVNDVPAPEENMFLQYGKDDGKDNAGFETGSCDWGNWPSDVTKEISEEQKRTGTKSLKVSKGSASDSFSEIGGVPVKPETTYILEAWFYCPEGSDITAVGLEAKHHNSVTGDGDHKLINAKITSDVKPDDKGWYKLTTEFTTENYNTVSVALSSSTATVYMDDAALYEAKEKLNRKALEEALELEPKRAETYYTPKTWKDFQDAKFAGRLKYADALAQQAEIDAAATKIADAYKALAKRADRRVLQAIYNVCAAKKQGTYSQTTWNAFQTAIRNAKTVLDNENATQAQVDEQLTKLKAARDGLKTEAKKAQVITYTKAYTKVFGAKAFKLNAKRTKGNGALSYKTSDSKVATVDKTGKVTVKGTGICNITVTAAATSTYNAKSVSITVTVKPKKAAISSLKSVKGKKLTVKWKKDAKATGYEIQCSLTKNFKKIAAKETVKKAKTTSTTLKKLTKGKKYYVRVRAYKDAKVGSKVKKVYGDWSKFKLSAKIK